LDGLPNSNCSVGLCAPDLPQIAAWKHALVIATTDADAGDQSNKGANVYALDKVALVTGAAKANTVLVRAVTSPETKNVYGMQPARQYGHTDTFNNYLMATDPGAKSGWVDTLLLLFRLLGTHTLTSKAPEVTLNLVEPVTRLKVSYRAPPAVAQKPGDTPYGALLPAVFLPYKLPLGDGRMGSVSFVNGKLYCVWGTAVLSGAERVGGIA
jgi:hypothetical protein